MYIGILSYMIVYIHNGSIYCNVYEPLCNIIMVVNSLLLKKDSSQNRQPFFWRFFPRKFSGLAPILPCWWTRMGTTLTNSGRKTRQPLDGLQRPVGTGCTCPFWGGPVFFFHKNPNGKNGSWEEAVVLETSFAVLYIGKIPEKKNDMGFGTQNTYLNWKYQLFTLQRFCFRLFDLPSLKLTVRPWK